MIVIVVQNTHSKIFYDEASDAEINQSEKLIKDHFQAEDSTLKHSPMVKRGLASPIRSFYISTKSDPRESENLLLTGFLDELTDIYDQNKLKYKVMDKRKYPAIDKQYLKDLHAGKVSFGKYIPRDYQIEALLAVAQHKSGIINSPMGSGKSFMTAMICKLFPKVQILMLFDQVDLIHQTRKAFIDDYKLSPDEVGIVQGKNVDIEDKRIILLSVDSYEKVMDIFPYVKVLILDEVHGIGSNTGDQVATRVMYSCQNASVRIGLSATPDIIDNPYRQKALYGNVGPIIYQAHMQEKISDGTLAKTTVEVVKVNGFVIPIIGSYADVYDSKKIKASEVISYEKQGFEVIYKEGDYTARKFIAKGDESLSYVFNERRNKIIADTVRNHDGRRVVLFSRMEHGLELLKLLPEAKLIHGKSDIEEREEAKIYLLNNPNGIVLASRIWDQGVDIKWLEILFIASAGVSSTRTVQRLGRAVRKSSETGKESAHVVDFYDEFNPLSLSQSKKRLRVYEKVLGFNVVVK